MRIQNFINASSTQHKKSHADAWPLCCNRQKAWVYYY